VTRANRNRNDGIRKVCACARHNWTKCDHPWYFNFYFKGEAYRYQLDKLTDSRITTKTEATGEAEKIRSAIRAGTFRRPGEEPRPLSRGDLSLKQLLELYGERVVAARGDRAKTAYDYAVGTICRTLVPTLNNVPLAFGDWKAADVTVDALEQFRDIRQIAGKIGTNRNLGTCRSV
jgi:hypothetical protein